jgi:23S rRNA (guanosine2251-2'-O)-methyltransferase
MITPEDDIIYIYGRHAVMEALRVPNRVLARVYIAPSEKDEALKAELKDANIPVSPLDIKKLPRELDQGAVHQGFVGMISRSRLMREYEPFMDSITISPDTALVVLGEVQDPQNVGAIIRSAAAFGIAGILFPEHNQAQVTGSVIKVSAGMAFQVPLVAIGNVNTTMRDLKERGFWIYGLAGEAETTLGDEVFDRPSAFVLGNEGKGMREKTKEVCDILLKIPMHPRTESLNVGASAAVALAFWSKGHPNALR